jgi:hypothetical protein
MRLGAKIEAVLDYSTERGWRGGENPARWRGHPDSLLPAGHQLARVNTIPSAASKQRGCAAFSGTTKQVASLVGLRGLTVLRSDIPAASIAFLARPDVCAA